MQGATRAIREHPDERMSRGVRVARGSVGALVATMLAAASHGIAGGTITWLAVAATALLALPLCTALAGRIGSLWRLGVAVSAAQVVYHWSFAGLGVSSGGTGAVPSEAIPAHAAHAAMLQSFAPQMLEAGAADGAMWIGHALAAALTIVLLHRGERAALALVRLVRRALPTATPRTAPDFRAPLAPVLPRRVVALRSRFLGASVTRRGPPIPA